MKKYALINHPADIAIKVRGQTLSELFANSAFALFDILADLEGLKGTVTVPLTATGLDYEDLLVRWLDELLYQFYTKGLIFCEFAIEQLDKNTLRAQVKGRYLNENRNRLKTEIKAVTYHDIRIQKLKSCYTVKLVFDI